VPLRGPSGNLDSDYTRGDVRNDVPVGHRYSAGFGRDANYRGRPAGDDPVVAGDSIKRGLAEGHPSIVTPVMITVGATVLALFPLALHSGPLWQPLCYTQIGGLCVATFVILLLVPMLYAIFVFDLILTWEEKPKQPLLARAAEVAAD
jgi:hypothetical protein